ncbi:Dna Excision Repair Protein Ercc-6-Like 2 [Manis pentadactyla]|nr:Dna Excision Repair Protein Ercc-6-Like 2 [Manis pentadactyla]
MPSCCPDTKRLGPLREGQVEVGVLTATTWLKEEPPVRSPGTLRDPENRGHRDPEQPPELLTEEGRDPCSDFSDEEPLGDSGVKAVKKEAPGARQAAGSPRQLSLLQCGFSKLSETKCEAVEASDGNNASDESSDEQPTCLSTEAKDACCQKSHDSLADHCCSLGDVTESEDNDVIFPTQYTTQGFSTNGVQCKPSMDRSEDPVTENYVKINTGDDRKPDVQRNGLLSKQLHSENMALKSVKRNGNSDISDETDDIEIPSKSRVRKQRATSSLRFKRKKESKMELSQNTEESKPTVYNR